MWPRGASGIVDTAGVILATAWLCGCALPPPETLVSPTPLAHNRGKYPCPYVASGALAPWADRAVHSDRRSAHAGAAAAGTAIGMIPIAADLFAEKVEQDMVKSAALKAAGGSKFMRDTSDQSFDKLDDLAAWHYINYSKAREFKKLQKFLVELYPYLAENYGMAVRRAKRKPTSQPSAAPA
jgi:hypothetical protein